ncbi:unnamed protein product [Arabidopsis arenosa]|uniref:MPN domain-containing protein n=1 Tax=Arabidopsis arenosa TaxID=38785 RepID=A0A8S2A5Q7_ARAAE|nr:unnamed protein product [Arabidopsis arenosa]
MALPSLRTVEIERMTMETIIKHCTESPITARGQLRGFDVGFVLEVTNCSRFPPFAPDAGEDFNVAGDNYQRDLMGYLREDNVGKDNVVWYQAGSVESSRTFTMIDTFMKYPGDIKRCGASNMIQMKLT